MPDKRDSYESLTGTFNDSLQFDSESKTVISFRDGVLTYLGSELGLEPADKEFTVYRSPATIANAANLMKGLPLTDEHVSLDNPPEQPVGSVESSEMIDLFDTDSDSTVGVSNRVKVTDLITGALTSGKRQASLGYGADLVPHDRYDFEQKKILPHHLAVVQAGRCGPACAFIDRKPKEDSGMGTKKTGQQATKPADKGTADGELIAAFKDAEGNPNLQQIVELAQGFPEAVRMLPLDKLQEIMPMLEEVMAVAKNAMGSDDPVETEADDGDGDDMDSDDMADEDMEKRDYTDSAAFKDAVAAAVAADRERVGSVIDKASNFLDKNYQYAGKSAERIMRDALATEHGETKFADEELTVAFKLLKAQGSNLKNFGDGAADAQAGRFSKQADKEI